MIDKIFPGERTIVTPRYGTEGESFVLYPLSRQEEITELIAQFNEALLTRGEPDTALISTTVLHACTVPINEAIKYYAEIDASKTKLTVVHYYLGDPKEELASDDVWGRHTNRPIPDPHLRGLGKQLGRELVEKRYVLKRRTGHVE